MSLADLASRQIAKARDAREENRRLFPFAASVMDAYARFNPTMKFAREGSRTIGKEHSGPWVDWFSLPYARDEK